MREKTKAREAQKRAILFRRALMLALTYAVLLVICLLAVSPEQYDIDVGDVAPQTITASRDIEDEITTSRRRQSAADAVSPVYYKDDTISDTVLADMESVFTELRAVRELGAQIKSLEPDETIQFSEEDYQQATGLLTKLTLSTYQLRTLMNTGEADFENLYQSLTSATRTALVSTITEGQIGDAINNIQQIVAYNTRTDLWYNVAIPTLRAVLQPNMLIDQQATEENRQRAYDEVEPTVYKQDQNIVVKGDRVSAEQIAVMEALGLLRGDSVDMSLYAGAAIIVALILAAVALYAMMFAPNVLVMDKEALVALLAVVLTLLVSLLVGRYAGVDAMPVTLAAMLVVSLVGVRAAYTANLLTTLLLTFLTVRGTGLTTSQALTVLFMGAAGGTAAIYMLRRNSQRVYVLVTGLVITAIEFVVIASMSAILSGEAGELLTSLSHAAVGSLTAAILCVGIQPMLETAFNLVTPAKLIELASPNQPLLRRLMIETPGTYHHAMVVANLAEAAAEEIGANALLARVGAYYHDIGKLLRPMYFKENQLGENPHDKTDPRVSTAILTAHTRDGAELARRHHLPEPIIDMILQHHGDTPVMYFYAKAAKQQGEENVDIADFRYEGPKPKSPEAAILMLSDTVEAAVRSIQEPNPAKISAMIRKLVRGKMEDGQLDECTLTFRDIGHICTAFETSLQGAFHQRIEYPNIDVSRAERNSQKRAEQREKERDAHAKEDKALAEEAGKRG